MSARPAGGFTVRGRTVTGGFALAVGMLLGVALIGGADDRPPDPEPSPPEHLGPLTATQPQLRRALLAGDEAAGPTRSPALRTHPAPGTGGPVPAPASARPPAGPPVLAELCRTLLEDPAGLVELWRSAPPREVTTRQTPRAGGATLHQMLGVFESGQAPAAFGRLREVASDCDHLPVRLSDGTEVTMLLRELSSDPAGAPGTEAGTGSGGPGGGPGGLPALRQPESATVPGGGPGPGSPGPGGPGAGYAAVVTVEGGGTTRDGWLSLDQVGPVVSVLRQLGPAAPAADPAGEPGADPAGDPGADPAGDPGAAEVGDPAGDLAETRASALGKLWRLLEALPGGLTGTG